MNSLRIRGPGQAYSMYSLAYSWTGPGVSDVFSGVFVDLARRIRCILWRIRGPGQAYPMYSLAYSWTGPGVSNVFSGVFVDPTHLDYATQPVSSMRPSPFYEILSFVLLKQRACGASQTSAKTGPGFSEHVISTESVTF